MTEQTTRRTQVTPGWTVSGTHDARLAAVSEWVRLRLTEAQRAEISIRRHESSIPVDVNGQPIKTFAMAENADVAGSITIDPVGVQQKTVNAMADHASRVMPISGVHILPTFGKGEHVAPYMGSTQSVTPNGKPDGDYATPEDADAWHYVATATMGDAFAARVISIMTSEATEHGRPVDHSKSDDVASEARMRAAETLAALMAREDVRRIHDYPLGSVDTGTHDVVGAVAEFLIPRARRCGACDGCERARARQSAGRASRWNVTGCTAPVTVIDAVTPFRIISRAIWSAASDATLATSAVYATRSKYLRKLATDVENDARVNVNGGDDPFRYVPDAAAGLVRVMTEALALIGEPATVQGGLSPAARALLTRALDTKDTQEGAETALSRARALWPRETGTRREQALAAADERHARRMAKQRERRELARMAAAGS